MPKEPERVALVDLDGTVAAFDKALKKDLRAILGTTKVPKRVEERIGTLIRQQPGWWERLPPLRLGQEIVALLVRLGFSIVVLTKGPRRTVNAWTEKVKWARQHLPASSVMIVEDKGLVYGKVLVDDYPVYIRRWLKWRPRGLVLMPAQRWNRAFRHPQVLRIRSIEDLEKAQAKLLNLLSRG